MPRSGVRQAQARLGLRPPSHSLGSRPGPARGPPGRVRPSSIIIVPAAGPSQAYFLPLAGGRWNAAETLDIPFFNRSPLNFPSLRPGGSAFTESRSR